MKVTVNLKYPLTEAQQLASTTILTAVKEKKNILVDAVCGAGKTELVYEAIVYILNCGGKVGFAIPRRDLVIEIHSRLALDFPALKITAVYGGQTSNLTGHIIVCTTHQLYRYRSQFSLLIIDEIDAFPYRGDKALEKTAHESVTGSKIFLSATVSEQEICNYKKLGYEVVTINKRYHNQPLPVP